MKQSACPGIRHRVPDRSPDTAVPGTCPVLTNRLSAHKAKCLLSNAAAATFIRINVNAHTCTFHRNQKPSVSPVPGPVPVLTHQPEKLGEGAALHPRGAKHSTSPPQLGFGGARRLFYRPEPVRCPSWKPAPGGTLRSGSRLRMTAVEARRHPDADSSARCRAESRAQTGPRPGRQCFSFGGSFPLQKPIYFFTCSAHRTQLTGFFVSVPELSADATKRRGAEDFCFATDN